MPLEKYSHCCGTLMCSGIPQIKKYPVGSSGDIAEKYYSHHFEVDVMDQIYNLNEGCKDGVVIVLRVVSSNGGIVHVLHPYIDSGSELQLLPQNSWVKMMYLNCEWHIMDGLNYVIV